MQMNHLFDKLNDEIIIDNHFSEHMLSRLILTNIWSLYFLHIHALEDDNQKVFITLKILISILNNNISNKQQKMKTKFEFLHQVLISRSNSEEMKTKFMDLFFKYQKYYFIISRFKMKFRRRRAITQITTDMYMNELDPTHKFTMKIYQGSSCYLFSLHDLMKIILSAITNTHGFMIWNPIPAKNPYTNIIFTKSELYSIYFKMKKTEFPIHPFLEVFFRCNFNIYKFRKHNEEQVKEYTIHTHVYTSNYIHLYHDVVDMISFYLPNTYIDSNYPADVLVGMMRPYLFLYYMTMFSVSQTKRTYYSNEAKIGLGLFFKRNPLVGRKMRMQVVENGMPNIKNKFFTNYIYPNYENTDYFLQDHIYEERLFNRYIFHGEHCYMDSEDDNNNPDEEETIIDENTGQIDLEQDEREESMTNPDMEPEFYENREDEDNEEYDSDYYNEVDEGIYDP